MTGYRPQGRAAWAASEAYLAANPPVKRLGGESRTTTPQEDALFEAYKRRRDAAYAKDPSLQAGAEAFEADDSGAALGDVGSVTAAAAGKGRELLNVMQMDREKAGALKAKALAEVALAPSEAAPDQATLAYAAAARERNRAKNAEILKRMKAESGPNGVTMSTEQLTGIAKAVESILDPVAPVVADQPMLDTSKQGVAPGGIGEYSIVDAAKYGRRRVEAEQKAKAKESEALYSRIKEARARNLPVADVEPAVVKSEGTVEEEQIAAVQRTRAMREAQEAEATQKQLQPVLEAVAQLNESVAPVAGPPVVEGPRAEQLSIDLDAPAVALSPAAERRAGDLLIAAALGAGGTTLAAEGLRDLLSGGEEQSALGNAMVTALAIAGGGAGAYARHRGFGAAGPGLQAAIP